MRSTFPHMVFILLIALVTLSCNGDVSAPPGSGDNSAPGCLDLDEYLHVTSIAPTNGSAKGVALRDGLLFIADGDEGLCVVDISDPVAPVMRGCATLAAGSATDIAFLGTDLVVAWGTAGVAIVDVGDPDRPIIIGRVSTPGSVVDVVVVGTTAYVADNIAGLLVMDVSDRAAPVIAGIENTPGKALGVAATGSIVYVADEQLGLRVVNVADPKNPWLVSSLAVSGASGVDVAGGFAFVAGGAAGMHVVNVSMVGAETLVNTVSTPGFAEDVAIANGIAYVADRAAGVELFDVTDPASPALVNWVRTDGSTGDVFVAGDTLAVADDDVGARVIRVPRVQQPPFVARTTLPGVDYLGVAADSASVVVADAAAGLAVMELNSAGLRVVGSLSLASPSEVIISGSNAYVASPSAAVSIVDLSDPAAPSQTGIVPQSINVLGMSIADSVLYMAKGIGGVLRYKLAGTDPVEQLALGTAFVTDVAATSTTVYASVAGAGLFVVKLDGFLLTNSVMLRGFGAAVTVAPRDDLFPPLIVDVAYVALSTGVTGGGPGVQIFSLLNPGTPVEIGFVDTSAGAVDVAITGNTLIVAEGDGGVELFDITDLTRPGRLGYYPTIGQAGSVAVLGGLLYVASGTDGLVVADLLDCAVRGQ